MKSDFFFNEKTLEDRHTYKHNDYLNFEAT